MRFCEDLLQRMCSFWARGPKGRRENHLRPAPGRTPAVMALATNGKLSPMPVQNHFFGCHLLSQKKPTPYRYETLDAGPI
jgi:hypothetical protein